MNLGAKTSLRRAHPLRVREIKLRGGVRDPEVTIARLALRGRPPASWSSARELVEDGLQQWPAGVTAKFLLLPGGFVSAPWPRSWSGCWGWDSDASDFEILKRHVEPCIGALISARVRRAAHEKVNVLVFGIDVGPDAQSGALAELAVVYDLASSGWHVTGKSFLRGDQRRVVRVQNLMSHFVVASEERVLVLGCHDLNIFSPRGRSQQQPSGRLAALRQEMDREIARFAPTVALQLPHGTDTPRTWIAAWNALTAATRLRAWASGIAFYHPGGDEERATFEEVCAKTCGGAPCMDLVT